ncbi:MAG: divalent metal cation transporter, partial [Proteobacteria bacterium]
ITRGLALIPAFVGVAVWGEGSVGRMLVLSQVVLSLQLPFAIFPLIRLGSDKKLMTDFVLNRAVALVAWLIFALISVANLYLLYRLILG